MFEVARTVVHHNTLPLPSQTPVLKDMKSVNVFEGMQTRNGLSQVLG